MSAPAADAGLAATSLLLVDPHVVRRPPTVDVVIPVYNEEDDLEP